MEKKRLKKLELSKKTVVELSKEEARILRGGQDKGKSEASTHAHGTHVNTCFTYNCCS